MTTLKADASPQRAAPRRGSSRDAIERRPWRSCGPRSSSFLLVITVLPFYYMVVLSFRPLDAVLQDPGALWPSRARSTSAPTVTSWPRQRAAARGSSPS